jgi:hypothetical protein
VNEKWSVTLTLAQFLLTAYSLPGSDVPQSHKPVISTAKHMQLVLQEANSMDRRFVPFELPQQKSTVGIEHLHILEGSNSFN